MDDSKMRLSDLVERETAEEIARKHMPNRFRIEVNQKTADTFIPPWIIDAMIEFMKGTKNK
jgi:hypothetical protein